MRLGRRVSERLDRWKSHLLTEVDGASLALFRLAFGAILFWEVVRFFVKGRIARYYIEPSFFFSFVPGVVPWGGSGMYWHFLLLGALALCMAAGLFYRVAAPLFCAAFTYVFLLDKAQYLNHLYLVCLLSLLLAVTPASRVFSLDRWIAQRRGQTLAPETVPRLYLFLLKAQVAIVYFYGGIAKLNGDWLRGMPLALWLPLRSDMPLLGPWLALPATALLFSWGGVLVDLSAGLLLFHPRTVVVGAVMCVLFNATNAVVFDIGIFPFVMMGALALFFAPDWPRRALRRLRGDPAASSPRPAPGEGGVTTIRRPAAALALAHVYLLVHLVVPLRHWLHPGDVNWTEEGHRFSWRMKLRDKEVGDLIFYVIDPQTGARDEVDLEAHLTDRQITSMATRPDMIADFARYVADRREAATGVRPRVTAQVTASLNGGPYRYLVDPARDLAASSR